jgi:tetratricopeptide (TPR) repeat protein
MRVTIPGAAVWIVCLLLVGMLVVTAPAGVSAQETPQQSSGPPEPSGPDSLFVDLPTEGLFEGIVPDQHYKGVLLRVPNFGGGDLPEYDLPRWAQFSAGGLRLILEQKLEYLPHIYGEQDIRRVMRYDTWLYARDVPRAGDEIPEGTVPDLEELCRRLNADFLFLLSYVMTNPAADPDDENAAEPEPVPLAGVFRYRRGYGYQVGESFALHAPDADAPDRMVLRMEEAARHVTRGIGATEDEDGNVQEVPHAPVPRLVNKDSSFRPFVQMRESLESGDLTDAWIAYEELMEDEPQAGRSALWAMDIFRGMGDAEASSGQLQDFRERSVRTGIRALHYVPNDVRLRGKMAWNVYNFYHREEWSLAALRQALQVQPTNLQLINWFHSVKFWWEEDRTRQAAWLKDNFLEVIADGRIEREVGHILYGSGDYAAGVEWYRKAIEKMPDDHDAVLSFGLCANYLAETTVRGNLPGEQGRLARERGAEIFAEASEHLWRAIMLDPLDVEYSYQFYARVTTRNFTWLPTDIELLDRIFLTQACLNGLRRLSGTFQFDRLVERVRATQIRMLRMDIEEAEPGDPQFEMLMLARLRMAMADQHADEVLQALREMRDLGLRPPAYASAMMLYGARLDVPEDEEDESEEEADAED